jgi:TonB family protein
MQFFALGAKSGSAEVGAWRKIRRNIKFTLPSSNRTGNKPAATSLEIDLRLIPSKSAVKSKRGLRSKKAILVHSSAVSSAVPSSASQDFEASRTQPVEHSAKVEHRDSVHRGSAAAEAPASMPHEALATAVNREQAKPDSTLDSEVANIDSMRNSRSGQDSEKYLSIIINELIQHKTYPAESKRRGEEGVVEVAFTLTSDGQIKNIVLQKPSSFERLNQAALASVRSLLADEANSEPNSKIGRAHLVDNATNSLSVVVPFEYRLR